MSSGNVRALAEKVGDLHHEDLGLFFCELGRIASSFKAAASGRDIIDYAMGHMTAIDRRAFEDNDEPMFGTVLIGRLHSAMEQQLELRLLRSRATGRR